MHIILICLLDIVSTEVMNSKDRFVGVYKYGYRSVLGKMTCKWKGNNAITANTEENAESGIYVRTMTKLRQRPT